MLFHSICRGFKRHGLSRTLRRITTHAQSPQLSNHCPLIPDVTEEPPREDDVVFDVAHFLTRVNDKADPLNFDVDEQTWMAHKGFNEDDVRQWLKIQESQTADESLSYTNDRTPVLLLMKVIQASTYSRRTFRTLVLIFKESLPRFDSASATVCLTSLLSRALLLDSALVRLINEDLLPRTSPLLSKLAFAKLLRMLERKGRSETVEHNEIRRTQKTIVRLMYERGLAMHEVDKQASGTTPSALRRSAIAKAGHPVKKTQLRQLAHCPTALPHTKTEQSKLQAKVGSVKACEEHVTQRRVSRGRMRDHRFWDLFISARPASAAPVLTCLRLIKERNLEMTTALTAVLLRSCKSADRKGCLDQIVSRAVERNVMFDTSTWVDYLERLIFASRYKEAISIVVHEPGGNDFLDMPAYVRRDPRVWSSVIRNLNQLVRRQRCSLNKHARLMGKLTTALEAFEVGYTYALVRDLSVAALLSGARSWNKRHSCDIVVTVFKNEVNISGEDWKVKPTWSLWELYMLVLVANEEVSLLDEAMQNLLHTGSLPSDKTLQTFALGIWESGSIEAIRRWQEYFDTDCEGAIGRWPSAEETFAHRRALSGPEGELRFFYK